ncbi:MAG: GNAT family N-acetyltransferase [Patescibacteria group bacterium]
MNANALEQEPKFTIETPKEGDETEIGKMHLQSWHESYTDPKRGVTKEVIDEFRSDTTTENGDERRRGFFREAAEHPDKILYKIVRNSKGEIVGFLHCTKGEEFNDLDAIYLLNEAKGEGVGGKLMEEFLAWSDKKKPSHLEVFSANETALGFYERYGFAKTDKAPKLYKDRLEYIEMMRPAEEQQD